MIPELIHYCWFGSSKMSKMHCKCINSWKKRLPGFEIIKWDEHNSPMDLPFVMEAYKNGKYAFVADYVRLWALEKNGGIYLDTDMLILKDLTSLLNNTCFVGYQSPGSIAAGVIGAIPHHSYILDLVKYYNELSFIEEEMSNFAIPIIMTNIANKKKYDIQIYESRFFYPFPFEASIENPGSYKKYIQKDSYAVHLWDASWIKGMKEYRKGKKWIYKMKNRFLYK